MAENNFFIDSDKLSKEALERKHKLETDPFSRTDHMKYMEGMEQIDSGIRDRVLEEMKNYDYNSFTAQDVKRALAQETCSVMDFKALLSPAAAPFLEEMAARAKIETSKHFGNTVYLFTPLYIANYCENYCIYCGFNCYNDIHRKKLTTEEIEHEMKIIADSGIEEILMLTGESRAASDVTYIGEACKLARKYFRNVGLEVYPMNTDEYRYLCHIRRNARRCRFCTAWPFRFQKGCTCKCAPYLFSAEKISVCGVFAFLSKTSSDC